MTAALLDGKQLAQTMQAEIAAQGIGTRHGIVGAGLGFERLTQLRASQGIVTVLGAPDFLSLGP